VRKESTDPRSIQGYLGLLPKTGSTTETEITSSSFLILRKTRVRWAQGHASET
jgi:hypothetical protein